VRIKGQSKRRRQSTGLPATAENRDAAEELRRQIESEIRDELVWGVHPSVPFEVAADRFLNRKRERGPLNPIDISRVKELERHFRGRRLNKIAEAEWTGFVDQRMQHCAAPTRERYIDLVMMLLAWCQAKPRQWIAELPSFDRDKAARQRTQRRARRVNEWRDELIELLIECASPHFKGQLAIMWTAGGRVSSLLYGCRLCDYLAAEGREQITFHDTKNGDDVMSSVHSRAAAAMREYLAWRGRLHDREGPLFLTDRRLPYTDNGKAAGGQTKTAWRWTLKRARGRLRRRVLTEVAQLRRQGQRAAARQAWLQLRSDLGLLRQLTPHWFRHRLATTLSGSADIFTTMEQGGWRDVRSVRGYTHDVPSRRRAAVEAMLESAVLVADESRTG
jgi:hypothetical protein